MNEFKEKKNGKGRFLRLPRLSYRDETIRVTFAMWYTLVPHILGPEPKFEKPLDKPTQDL